MASTGSWRKTTEDGMEDYDMTQAVFDLDNIETGWGLIQEAEAPQWVMDVDGKSAPKPGDEWKRGFKVPVFSPKLFGDEPIRDFATTGTGAVMGIQELYTQYEAELKANAGKVPVVAFEGGTPTKVGKGNTNVPKLKIVKWVDRPSDLANDNTAAPVEAESAGQTVDDDEEF